MAKSKQRKDHKKKIAKRREQMKQERTRYQKMQHEMLMKLIEQERLKGMYTNTPEIPQIPQLTPNLPLEGPSIEGPSI